MHDHISVFCLVSSEGALSRSLLVAHGRRRRRDAHWHAAKDMRDRVFTLLMRAYTEAQFAIAYVRRYDEQSDRRLPSIWAGRERKRRTRKRALSETATTPSADLPTPTSQASPAESLHAETSEAHEPAADRKDTPGTGSGFVN